MNPHFPSASALSRLRPLWPALAGAGVLALVATTLGGGEIVRRLGRVDSALFALAVLAVQPQVVLSALRWRFVSERLGQALPIGRAVGEYYFASLLNQVLPGGVAGDAVRAVRATRQGGDGRWTGPGAQAVVLDRLSGQIVLFFAAGIGLLATPFAFGAEAPGGMGVLALLASALTAGLVGWIALRLLGERAAGFRRAFGPALAESFVRRGAWAVQATTSLAVVGSYLLVFAVSAAAVGAPLGFLATLLLVPLVLLSMLIPVSIGGWGLREAAAAAILPLAGLQPDAAFAASVVYGVASLVGALPGLLVLLRHAVFARWRAAT